MMTGGADVYLNLLWRTLCGGDVYDWSLACVGSEHFQYFAIKIYKSLFQRGESYNEEGSRSEKNNPKKENVS